MITVQQGKYKIEFDEEKHNYTVDGKLKTGVSSIINKVLKNDAEIPEYAKPAVKKGTMVHKVIHLHNEKKLDVGAVDKVLLPYFESYLKWAGEVDFCPVKNEMIFYEETQDYCGIVDVIGNINKRRVLIDYKTGGMYDTYPWQITGYTYFAVRNEILIDRCGCLQLFKDGKIAKFHEYSYRFYEPGWENICGVYRIKTGEYK